MSLILSIETGTNICSVALSENGELKSLRESEEGLEHAKNLALFISEILTENEIEVSDIDAVAVGIGPGSYTGLRIGVSVAKGLCFAENIPLIGVSSLESLVCIAKEDYEAGISDIENIDTAYFCPMIDARRMEVYAGVYNHNLECISPVAAHIIDDKFCKEFRRNNEFIIFGNGAQKCTEVLTSGITYFPNVIPSARGHVSIAHQKFDQKIFEDVAYFEPFYLKDFVATHSLKQPLKRVSK